MVKFNVEIHNQGNTPFTNVLLQELYNEGWEYIAIPSNLAEGWTEETNGDLSILYDETLEAGDVDTICLELQLLPDFNSDSDSWKNYVEIVSYEHPDSPGEAKQDIDSTPDDDNTNDSGGNPSDETNDVTSGDGSGDPTDSSEDVDPTLDEDDQDPEDYKVFDLAVTIAIDSMPPVLPVVPGDILKFNIVTTNQGNTDATDVLISNYLMPGNLQVAAMSAPLGWTIIDAELSQIALPETLSAGEVDSTCIYLEVVNGGMADMITWVEISGSSETDGACFDIDSTPDDDNSNDVGGAPETEEDNHITDDGADGNVDGITDEDDHDPAQIFVQDLALIVWTDHKEPVKVNQDVNFKVRVVNQGNILNDKIKVVTYLPEGFMLSSSDTNGWVEESDVLLSLSLPASLAMGETVEVDMLLQVKQGATAETLIVYSEIAGSIDENGRSLDDRDVDSTPDEDNTNDTGGEPQDPIDCDILPTVILNDNLLTGAGKNGGDEDDHDPAWVHIYDLATIIYTNQTLPIIPGDDIKFEVEIHNQGNMAAEEVELSLYLPDGFALSSSDDNGWTVEGDNLLLLNYDKVVEPSTVDSTCLVLTVQPDYMLESLIPFVEISSAMDTLGHDLTTCDFDSDSDGDPKNDIGGFPDSSDDNMVDGSARMGEDEDDHDPVVPPVLDLAVKIVNTDLNPKEPGDVVKFIVTVYNQGSITPKRFTIRNYTPDGLVFFSDSLNANWNQVGTDAEYSYTSALPPASSDTFCLFLAVDQNPVPETTVTMIEISEIMDDDNGNVSARDIDSVSEADNSNDVGNDVFSVHDNQIFENGRSGEDEDDHDQAFVYICHDMLCIEQVNISLNSDCEATLTADMLIAGVTYPDSLYEFNIRDHQGNFQPIETLELSHLGPQVIEVVAPLCDNSCWSNVLIEYKHVPILACPDTIEVFLAHEERNTLECGEPDSDLYTHIVSRQYQVRDEMGNILNSCKQKIYLERIVPGEVKFPAAASINCSDLGSLTLNAQGCPEPWFADDELGLEIGHPYLMMMPNMGTGSGTGSGTPGGFMPDICVPGMDAQTMYEDQDHGGGQIGGTGSGTGSGTPMNPANPMIIPLLLGSSSTCTGFVTYTDLVLPQIGCTKKFIRTWEVLEWNCGVEIQMPGIPQVIEVIDDAGPVIDSCPAPFEVTTNDDCAGDIELPLPEAHDACGNGINIKIEHPWGLVEVVEGVVPTATLETGKYTILYKVTDDCNNESTCSTQVTVKDNTQPVAICEQNTVVSISLDGNTIVSSDVFDDGSWDECGPVSSCAMKMSDLLFYREMTVDTTYNGVDYVLKSKMDSGCLQEYVGGVELGGVEYLSEDDLCVPYVRFCCTDVGLDQMIIFRVIDGGGNHSDCMVNVEVQDKAIPSVTCPASMTIDCRVPYDLNNLGLQFGNYILEDNCGATQVVDTLITPDLNQCGQGTIERQFTISSFGQVVMDCKQLISITNEAPFVADNITWPQSFTAACGSSTQLTPEAISNNAILGEIFARPSFAGADNCSLLGYDYEDQFFASDPINQECGIIQRKWSVIDWCTQLNGSFSIFEHIQTITIEDDQAPIILMANDTTVMSSNASCTSVELFLWMETAPDCTPEASLVWDNVILDAAGNPVTEGAGGAALDLSNKDINVILNAGEYLINWSVADGCGNRSTVAQNVTVINTKLPVPICKNGLAITLDNQGNAELWATDLDAGSYHPCGDNLDFTLAFDAAGTETFATYHCDTTKTYPYVEQVRLYVIDEQTGLGDYCTATVEIQDPTEACGDQMMVEVTGEVYTETLQRVSEVKVELDAAMPFEMTGIDGTYAFGQMPIGGDYELKPSKNDNHMNGVNTLDLIMIQRHLLDIEALESPYKLLAADVNNSESLNGVDLVELRKLILGIYAELPDNTSWRFVDAEYEFADAHDPWSTEIAEIYDITALNSDMHIDFIGVKVGDVNNDVELSLTDDLVGTRSSRWPVILEHQNKSLKEGDMISLPFHVRNYERVSGWQTTLEWDVSKFEVLDVKGIDESHLNLYNLKEGWLTMSHHTTEEVDKADEEIIFEVVVKAVSDVALSGEFTLSSKVTKSEAYRGRGEVVDLLLDTWRGEEAEILSINPNPWITSTEIEFSLPNASNGEWEFYDSKGSLLLRMDDQYAAGKHILNLSRDQIDAQGVVFVRFMTDSAIVERKMLLIK